MTTSTQRVRASDQRLKDAGGMVIKVRLDKAAADILRKRKILTGFSYSDLIHEAIIYS